MIYRETRLNGAFVIELEKNADSRGFFARTWCQREFQERGLNPRLVQCNISFNKKAGTLRGMHYQAAPCQEAKLVRCTRGSIFDVIIDLRPNSSTYKGHLGVRLSADEYTMLYIPEGFAHGFQTLVDNTEVFYQMSEFYSPEAATGVRWDDPVFGIAWPATRNRVISKKDMNWPFYSAVENAI
jgi:dTDP-4-dehydrorhamnose 3,5-epimerase